MAPDGYMNTYRAYKAGTTKLATWLIESAQRVKADLTFLPADSTSGLPTKVPVNHFTRLAKSIVASQDPEIRIPRGIIAVTRLVIDLRKQAETFFERLGHGGRVAAETTKGGHRHFISVLEDVLNILQPSTGAAGAENDELVNMFAALNVEEPVSEGSPAAPSKPKKSTTRQYEIEMSGTENIFAIFAYFKDLNEIRDYLMSVWRDYRNGKLDLMAAAVTTDTAFNLVKFSSQDISDSVPGIPNYPAMVATLMQYVDSRGGLTEDFSQWVFLDTASLLASYADVLEPDKVPALKPGHFGEYNPRQDRSKLSPEARQQEDLIILMEWLPEVTKISRARAQMPLLDELTAGLLKVMDACDVEVCPPHAVFGTRIFLDIHHILRAESTRPFDQMQATGKRAIGILDDYFRFSRGRLISTWPQQNDQVFQNIKAYAKDWTQTDVMSKLLTATFRSLGVKSRPYFYLKNHPVLCGLITFRLNMMLQEGGITLCGAWGSVLYPAHLYNAARQSAALASEWEDMDYVISLHSAQRIFVGAPPTSPQEYLRRFLLCLGASASNFARNRRPGGGALIVESKKGPRGLKTTTPVRDIFDPRYGERGAGRAGAAALTTPNIVAMLSVAGRAERTSPTSVDLRAFAREMLVLKRFSGIQMLTAVREGVAAEEMHLLFDYFGLHQRGLKLLRALQTHVHADLVRYFSQDYIDDESQLPHVIGYVFEVVRGSDRIAEELRVRGASELLHKAADVLERFIKDGENGRRSHMNAMALSDTVVHAFHTGNLDSLVAPSEES